MYLPSMLVIFIFIKTVIICIVFFLFLFYVCIFYILIDLAIISWNIFVAYKFHYYLTGQRS